MKLKECSDGNRASIVTGFEKATAWGRFDLPVSLRASPSYCVERTRRQWLPKEAEKYSREPVRLGVGSTYLFTTADIGREGKSDEEW